MADDTTDKDKPSAISSWVTQHKKSIIIAAVLFGVVIVYMIAKHNSSAQNAASGTGSVNTTGANAAIPSVGGGYYGGGGEFGGGYATSNNFGQIEQQLASINTAIGNLSAGNTSTSSNPTGSPTPPNHNPPPVQRPPAPPPAPHVIKAPFNLNGLTVSQAEHVLSQYNGKYYIQNISNNGQWSPANAPPSVLNSRITSFTPYSSGAVRVN